MANEGTVVVGAIPYRYLDPGVRGLVRALADNGFTPTDSGDGVSKPAVGRVLDFPHVFMVTAPCDLVREADRLSGLLPALGCEGLTVDASYRPGEPGIVGLFDLRQEHRQAQPGPQEDHPDTRIVDELVAILGAHPDLPCFTDEFSREDVPALAAVLLGLIDDAHDYKPSGAEPGPVGDAT